MKIASFDLYDTLVTRIWFRPTDIFYGVGKTLADKYLIDKDIIKWHEKRLLAEKSSREESLKEEISLEDIYCRISKIYNWDNLQRITARNIEIDLEISSVYPIEYSVHKVNKLRIEKENIVFITDIYLPKEIILKILINAGLWQEGDRLFISSDVGLTKHTGNIYKFIMDKLSLKSSDIIHFGDNWNSDIDNARKSGIAAEHFSLSIPTRYEDAMYSSKIKSKIAQSLLPGVAKTVRLSSSMENEHLQNIWNIGANVIGPVLFGFVLWVLEEAKKNNKKRLYFIARDGQILSKLGAIISGRWGFGIECRYLLGSKRAWVLSAITDPNEISIDRAIQEISTTLSVASVCDYFDIEPNLIKDSLSRFNFRDESWNSVIKDELDLKRLRKCFRDGNVLDSILQKSRENRKNAIGYLIQEGLLDDFSYAVVDSGWGGTLHYSLSKLIRMAINSSRGGLTGYYFGVSYDQHLYKEDIRTGWYYRYNELKNKYITKLSYMLVFETFLSADHGTTIKYEMDINGKYIPIINQNENTNVLKWGLIELHKAIISYGEMLTKHCKYGEVESSDFLNISGKLLKYFMLKPIKEEALVVESYDQLVRETNKLLFKMRMTHIIRVLIFGRVNKNETEKWIEGSMAISGLRFARNFIRLFNIRSSVFIWLNHEKNRLRRVVKRIKALA